MLFALSRPGEIVRQEALRRLRGRVEYVPEKRDISRPRVWRAHAALLRHRGTAYGAAVGGRRDPANRALLDLFLIEKAAYEIGYEAANRPAWLRVPLAGLSRLLRRGLQQQRRSRHG